MSGPSSKPQILIAEDDELFRTLLRRFLEPAYLVVCAENGEEALRLVETNRPELILTDIIMPKMTGVELLRRLRESPDTKTIPVAILLATASPDDLLAAEHLHADAVLPKERATRALVLELVRSLLKERTP